MKKIPTRQYSLILSISLFATCTQAIGLPSHPETPEGFYDRHSVKMARYTPLSEIPSHQLRSTSIINLDPIEALNMTPAKNQGPLGTCTSFAVGACVEYFTENISKTKFNPVSEAEFTVYAETHIPGEDCKQGLNLGEALIVARDRGFIHESKWTYSEYLKEIEKENNINEGTDGWQDEIEKASACPRNKYSTKQLDKFPKYKLKSLEIIDHTPRESLLSHVSDEIHRAPIRSKSNDDFSPSLPQRKLDIEDVSAVIKGYLHDQNVPVAVGLPTFEKWGDNPDIEMPDLNLVKLWDSQQRNNSLSSIFRGLSVSNKYKSQSSYSVKEKKEIVEPGWHSVVLCGYNNNTGKFKFKNSWGQEWGDKGYGWIPYEYVNLYASEIVATFG